MSHRAISMPLIAWMAAPWRPKKMLPSYMRWIRRSISNGSWPSTHSASPRQILCDSGASMTALATSDEESTSPTPTRPASVWTLTTRVSWLPSQRSLTSGRRRWIGSTRVIFMAGSILRQQDEGPDGRPDLRAVLVPGGGLAQGGFVDRPPALGQEVGQVEGRIVEELPLGQVVAGAVAAHEDIFAGGHGSPSPSVRRRRPPRPAARPLHGRAPGVMIGPAAMLVKRIPVASGRGVRLDGGGRGDVRVRH